MDSGAGQRNAARVEAPAAIRETQRRFKNTPGRARSQPGDGRKAAACFISTVLREARKMADENLRRGPGPGIAVAVKRAREALDRIDWLCAYVEHEEVL